MKSLNASTNTYVTTNGTQLSTCLKSVRLDRLRPKLIDRHFSSSNGMKGDIKEIVDRAPMEVHTPDSDCDEALRMTALLNDLDLVQRGGKPMFEQVTSSNLKRDSKFETEEQVLAAASRKLVHQYRELVDELQSRVLGVFQGREDMTFCFVEGFLLFADPATIPSFHDINPNSACVELETLAQSKMAHLLAISHELSQTPDMINPSLELERDKVKRELYGSITLAKKLLQSKFDIKLFLPTTKQLAKKRREGRALYIDVEVGGERKPGQMWKCEGYFDDVAWRNFERTHEWLEGGEGGDHEAKIRPGVDPEIGFAVRWAVEAILEGLGYGVVGSRGLGCCGEGC